MEVLTRIGLSGNIVMTQRESTQNAHAMALEELTDAAGTGRAAILAPSQAREILRLLRGGAPLPLAKP